MAAGKPAEKPTPPAAPAGCPNCAALVERIKDMQAQIADIGAELHQRRQHNK